MVVCLPTPGATSLLDFALLTNLMTSSLVIDDVYESSIREGDLHRWMRQIGHDGRLFKSTSDPVEVHSMAQRLSSEERVRVDEMASAGVDVDEVVLAG